MALHLSAAGAVLVLLLSSPPAAQSASVPFWGDRESQPVTTDPSALKPGQWVWAPGLSPEGPITVLVSIDEQRAFVYRNGVRVGYTTVSTGRQGYDTPTGVFTVLQKDAAHRSTIYNSAPMPYMERLTWGGVALHAGGLPGYPSSHGCVHLPSQFAQDLFAVSPMGMTVVITKRALELSSVKEGPLLAPISAASGAEIGVPPLAAPEAWRWTPEASPAGPISIVLSTADLRLLVMRNGVEIGRSRITLADPARPLGSHVFVLKDENQWMSVGLPGSGGEVGRPLGEADQARVNIPPEFRKLATSLLEPGATLVVTDQPILPATTGVPLSIMNADPPGHPGP